MTTPYWQKHVGACIAKARIFKGESLPEELKSIKGFSTTAMRSLYADLAAACESAIEVGSYAGGVLLSMAALNPKCEFVGFENESEEFGNTGIHAELYRNITKLDLENVQIIDEDFFKVNPDEILEYSQLCIFDGVHTPESQRKAVSAMAPYMDDICLFCVDDISWDFVLPSTRLGLNDISKDFRVVKQWEIYGETRNDDPLFHNGLGFFLLERVSVD